MLGRLHMGTPEAIALAVAIFVTLLISIFLPFAMLGKQWRAAEDQARARRLAEHRMNARLLRLGI